MTKYGFDVSVEDFMVNIKRLTNQLWKLIPMYENNEDWKKQLDSVILEIAGLNEIMLSPQFLQLLSKLEGIKTQNNSFELHRRTVFQSISLLQELSRNVRL